MTKRNKILPVMLTAAVAALFPLTQAVYGQDANNSPIHMVGILANMQKTIDAKKAKPGDTFTAKTVYAATLNDGTVVPKGSLFEGHVVSATPSKHHSDSTLVVTIDKLKLKRGKEISVKAVIMKVASLLPDAATLPSYQNDGTNIGGGGVTTAKQDTAISSSSNGTHPVKGFTVTSSVTGSTSGTFAQQGKNVHLSKEDQLGIGVAVIPAGVILEK